MKKASTLAACGILSLTMAASALSGCGQKAVDGTQTAMVIDGEEISLGLANYFLRTEQAGTYYQMSGMLSYFGGDENTFWTLEGDEGVTYGESMKDSMVTDITKLVEIRKHAEELGVSVTDADKENIETAATAFMEKNAEVMEELGVSVDNVKEALELKTLEIRTKPEMIKDTDREVSDDEAAQSTCTYIRLAKSDDETEAADQKASMEEILKKVLAADKGSDIGEIAEEVNESCYSAQYAFNKGAYDDENNVLDSAVKEVLQTLGEDEVYDKVIEGESYYFIIRMDKFFDRDETDEKKESIITERETEKYNEVLDSWTEGITPETKSCWDKIVVDDSVKYTTSAE